MKVDADAPCFTSIITSKAEYCCVKTMLCTVIKSKSPHSRRGLTTVWKYTRNNEFLLSLIKYFKIPTHHVAF